MNKDFETSSQSLREDLRCLGLDAVANTSAHMAELENLKARIEAGLQNAELPPPSRDRLMFLISIIEFERESLRMKAQRLEWRMSDIKQALEEALEVHETEGELLLREAS